MTNPVKKQFIFLIFLAIFVGTGITLTVILPSYKTIAALEKDINQTQEFLEKQYEKTQRLRRSVHEINTVLESTQTFEGSIIEVGNELKIITELETLAQTHNIQQTLNVAFADPAIDGGNKTEGLPAQLKQSPYYTLSFLNNGSYSSHLSYLKEMEEMDYYFIISSMQWENRQQGQPDGDITVRFDATLYATK